MVIVAVFSVGMLAGFAIELGVRRWRRQVDEFKRQLAKLLKQEA